MNRRPNKLVGEKSPYLLQHAYNPVAWHPWGKEAFEKARREDKPVFLSIGYSTCHWCHVMEKESFEDDEVAKLMNEAFVSIKVDREERTDLDHIYMTVCQMLTGSGGWPLTIVMTPDKKPFFAATYVPKTTRFGRMGLMDLIPRLREIWLRRRDEALVSAEKVVEALRGAEKTEPGPEADASLLGKAYRELAQRFDAARGGFSQAPKFPMPHNLSFILRFWKRTGKQEALQMAEKTLQEMRRGGIYDQIGFGFHRYSTDSEWLVPHFEKMLYDQALLAIAYLEAFQATGNYAYADTAKEVFSYVLRDMKAPEGGFYSAEDADSEGVEGKYYVWREGEIRDILGDADAEVAAALFGTSEEGNFSEEGTGERTGANILRLKETAPDLARRFNASPAELEEKLKLIKKKLFDARGRRTRPQKDDKILTDWNGLTAAAFARGAQVLGEPHYLQAAKGIAKFVFDRLTTPEGRLLHRYRGGEAGVTAHLDDYAFFVWGLIELYQACFEPFYLRAALDLNKDMLIHYWDDEEGGLFFVPDDGEAVLVRKKEIYDGAVPSGNSVAMLNLLRLARLTGEPDLEARAFRMGRAFSSQVEQMPSGFTQFLAAVDFGIGPSYEVVVAGPREAPDVRKMLDRLRSPFLPNVVLLYRPSERRPEIDDVAGFVAKYDSIEGKATAYVCSGKSCNAPTTEVDQMLDSIK